MMTPGQIFDSVLGIVVIIVIIVLLWEVFTAPNKDDDNMCL